MNTDSIEALIGQFTLTELAERSGKTVNEIVAFAMRNTAVVTKKVTLSKARIETSTNSTNKVDTRTPAGRAAYDEAVLDYLGANRGTWIGAGDLRRAVGGSALQVRTALARLLESSGVEYQGVARGTEYRL
jgi:hypothetical protein